MSAVRTVLLSVLMMTAVACSNVVGSGDGVVDEDEVPGVGWFAELDTLAHDVSGTAVIVDEDTIEIEDFVYDGGGLNARFFLLADGAEFDRDIELTDNLVGSPSDGQTLTLTIPNGVAFDEWNFITLWCIPAGVSFGEGVFEPPVL
ncbi:MAG: DM13 domain-containing protein [Myxococcota bacterium]